jgi:hypothetical protein
MISNQEQKEYLITIILVVIFVFILSGCCHYKEYYPSGTLKKEFHGIEFSDNKTIEL